MGQFKYRYTPEGQYATVTFPNGQSRNYSYDWAGRLLQLANLHPTAGNLATYSYGYDVDWATGLTTKKGQRTSMTADVPAQGLAGALTKYYYDTRGQLTGADYPAVAPFNGEVARWTYDAIGNRLTPGTYSYRKIGANSKNSLQLMSVEAAGVLTNFTYDTNGNTASRSEGGESFTFGYDFANRLISLGGNVLTAHEYDYSGRRVSKIVGGNATHYLLERQNVLADGLGWSLFGPQLDEPLARVVTGQAYYYSIDALGSVVELASSSGEVRNSYSYRAWGEIASMDSSIENPFTYTAREAGEAGAMYYRARYYSPITARFLSEDPLRLATGPNFYAYVRSNPVKYKDPLGLWHVSEKDVRDTSQGEGTTMCDGAGRVVPWIPRKWYEHELWPCAGECIQMHEWSHANDQERSNPGLCDGKREYLAIETLLRHEKDFSEFRAWTVEKRCLEHRLKRCDSACQGIIEWAIKDAERVLRDRAW